MNDPTKPTELAAPGAARAWQSNALPCCERASGEGANFCPQCGAPTVRYNAEVMSTADRPAVVLNDDDQQLLVSGQPQMVIQVVEAPSPLANLTKAFDNRALVIGLLLCVGPMGLPALWLSRRFSPTAKILTTVAYFALTVLLPLAFAWYLLEVPLRPLVEALH